jgi:uncharacterized membrane protein YidH (DUF202 family)
MEWTMRWERYVLEDTPDGEVYPVFKEVCPQAGDSDLNIELAAKCTELASDQTLLARVRTALALMATGVIFDAGVRALYDDSSFTGSPWLRSAQLFAMVMTGAITLLLTLVACSHLRSSRLLALLQHRSPPRVTWAFVIAALRVLFGLAVMVLLTLLSY